MTGAPRGKPDDSAAPVRSPAGGMRSATGVAINTDAGAAAAEATNAALAGLRSPGGGEGAPLTFLALFLSSAHADAAAEAARVVCRTARTDAVIGVTAQAVVGGSHEYEERPAAVVLAASLPGVSARSISSDDLAAPADFHEEPDPDAAPDDEETRRERLATESLRQLIDPPADLRGLMLFADPFSVPMAGLLRSLDRVLAEADSAAASDRPAPSIFGGLASAADRADGNALICGERVQRHGFVGLTIAGECRVDVVVSQGCTPIGPDLVVTKAKGNMIMGLAGKPALRAIRDVAMEMTEEDRERLGRGVLLGRVVNEYKERFGRGDYLIRGIVGADEDSGAIASSEQIRVGQTVRLHVRDARTSEEDLALLLDAQRLYEEPAAGLLFTCNGRGRRLYDEPDRDATLVQRAFAPMTSGEVAAKVGEEVTRGESIPLAGFFAAGEIGPTGGSTHVHGQTACLALVRPRGE